MSQTFELEAGLVAAYVASRVGVSASGPRQPELTNRVMAAMARAGVTSGEAFRRLIERDDHKFDELAISLTVGESYFFREASQMELLRQRVLPERAEVRGPAGALRLWSAGCSEGQEAYTLAILLDEEGLGLRSRILATDLSEQSLERARRGVYGKWSLRALDDHRRRAYFRPVAGGHRIDPRLARSITFRQGNLLDNSVDEQRGNMDVVLCRNVLVYLTPAAVEQVTQGLVASLAPGGWLMTASTDPRLEDVAGLETVLTPEGIVYRRVPEQGQSGAVATRRSSAPASRRTSSLPALNPKHVPSPLPKPLQTPVEPVADRLAAARRALEKGDYELAAALATALAGEGGDGEAEALLVRAAGSAGQLEKAVAAAAEAVARFPLHIELRLLHAIVLLESDRPDESAAAAKAALYIDQGLVMAHLTLARAEQARGDGPAAARSYRNALGLLDAMPADQAVALADGDSAVRLAGLARAALARAAHHPVPRPTSKATTP